MPARWLVFRIVCILQMLGAAVYGMMGLIDLTRGVTAGSIISIALFTCIFLLTVFALQLLHSNYPAIPVTGKQKTMFNRLFLVNFLFLVFSFGTVFAEYHRLAMLASLLLRRVWDLPFRFFAPFIISVVMLLFQLIILYGLYVLRRELYANYTRKEFDFEKSVAE